MKKPASLLLAILLIISCLISFSYAADKPVPEETNPAVEELHVESGEEQEPVPEEETLEEKPEEKPEANHDEGQTNESQSNVGQIAEGQSAESQTTEGRPTEGQPIEDQTTEDQPTEGQPTEGQVTEGQPAEGQTTEGQPAEDQPMEGQATEGQPAEGQTTEGQPAEDQPMEGQTTEDQPTEGQTVESQMDGSGQPEEQEGDGTGEPSGTEPAASEDEVPKETDSEPDANEVENSATISAAPAKAWIGQEVTFTVLANPSEGVASYGWQLWDNDEEGWRYVEDASYASASLTITVRDISYERKYRCKVSFSQGRPGTVETETVTVTQPTVTVKDTKGGIGETIKLNATLSTSGDAEYQWQYRQNEGSTWNDLKENTVSSNVRTATLSYKIPTPGKNFDYINGRFRCKVTVNGQVVYSNEAMINRPFSATVTCSPAGVAIGTSVTLTAKPTGMKDTTDNLKYQWQYSTDGGKSWESLSVTKTKNKATFKMTEPLLTAWFRCLITDNKLGSKIDSAPRKTIPQAFTVNISRTEIPTGINEPEELSVTLANATGTASYQWEYSADGGETWKNVGLSLKGRNNSTLLFNAREGWISNAYQFRCMVTVGTGYLFSEPARLVRAVDIQAVFSGDGKKGIGEQAVMSLGQIPDAVSATAFCWQRSTDGKSWENIENKENEYDGTSTGTLTATVVKDKTYGYQYRCLVTVQIGDEDYQVITVNSLQVSRPFSVVVDPIRPGVGETITLKASAPGKESGTEAYFWEKKVKETGEWEPFSEEEQPEFTAVGDEYGTVWFRCLLTANGQQVDSAPVTVEQPYTVTVKGTKGGIGETIKLKATPSVSGDAEYQWQYSQNKGKTWTDLKENKVSGQVMTNTLSYKIPDTMNYDTNCFRCKASVEGTNGPQVVLSDAVYISRPYAVSITGNKKLNPGDKVKFTVTVSGNPTYKWQYSTNGGASWTNCTDSSCKTKTLALTVSNTIYARQYRCLVTVKTVKTVSSVRYVEPPNINDFKYVSNTSGYWQITGYTGSGGAVSVPAGRQGKKVYSVAKDAFKGNTAITSVKIPPYVSSIGASAFEGCTRLTTVTLPDKVATIGEGAFRNCNKLSNMKIANK